MKEIPESPSHHKMVALGPMSGLSSSPWVGCNGTAMGTGSQAVPAPDSTAQSHLNSECPATCGGLCLHRLFDLHMHGKQLLIMEELLLVFVVRLSRHCSVCHFSAPHGSRVSQARSQNEARPSWPSPCVAEAGKVVF